MAQAYLGNTALNQTWLGNIQINDSVFLEYPVQGLTAIYNPKAPGGYSANTIYDLSGNGNNLTLTGNYSVGTGSNAGSIYFDSGSSASTVGNLSTSLHGTGSEFTIVSFYKKVYMPSLGEPDYYLPAWYIGSTSNTSSAGQQIWEYNVSSNSPNEGFGVSVSSFSSSYNPPNNEAWKLYQMTGSIVAPPSPTYLWSPVDSINTVTSDLWSFTGLTKEDQTLSYTAPNNNYTLYADGYWITNSGGASSKQVTGSLLSSDDYGSAYPSAFLPYGGFTSYIKTKNPSDNKISTNLQSSRLYINPVGSVLPEPTWFAPTYPSAYQEFWFGGFAVYNRVLSKAEVTQLDAYFQNQY